MHEPINQELERNYVTIKEKLNKLIYEGWNFNNGNYLFTNNTK